MEEASLQHKLTYVCSEGRTVCANAKVLACRRKEPGNSGGLNGSNHCHPVPGIWQLQSECRTESCGCMTIYWCGKSNLNGLALYVG